jgi:hypothetical protein
MRTAARAAIGFTVKSGWGAAVLLTWPAASPVVMDSRRVELSDPALPESRQPYHAGFGTARAPGKGLSTLVSGVKRFGRDSMAGVIRDYQATGCEIKGAGLIVGSLADPESIANDHIRIHALEGRLFRGIVEDAAACAGLPCAILRERDLYETASGILNQSGQALRVELAELGRSVSGPWRAEQKAATLAAWLILAGRVPVTKTK